MEMNQLTATELIKATKEELLKARYTNLSLKGLERVWINLEKYLQSKGIDYFSMDVGLAFLKERYHFSEAQRLPSINGERLRAIQLLADIQMHQRISIRRKHKRYQFASPFETTFCDFMEFKKNAGISNKTLASYTIYLERFSQYLLNHEVTHIAEIAIPHIQGFIQSSAVVYRTATIYCISCLLRVLFRYLYDQKITSINLSLAVPSVHCSKKSKIPSAYSQEEMRQLLSCIDRGNPKGKRDYAMLLIAVRLGMRASDICGLTFDNFKWEANTIELKQGKTNEPIVLPLLNDVGEAVIDYIKYGRPIVEDKEIFLRFIMDPEIKTQK